MIDRSDGFATQLSSKVLKLRGNSLTFPEFVWELFTEIQKLSGPFRAIIWREQVDGSLTVSVEFSPILAGYEQGFSLDISDEVHGRSLRQCLELREILQGLIKSSIDPENLFRAWMCPIVSGNSTLGVLEIFIPSQSTSELSDLANLEIVANWLSAFLTKEPDAKTVKSADLSEGLEDFLLLLHQSLNLKYVGLVASTEGRTFIGCDRVSVLQYHGSQVRVLAVSGAESIQRRGTAMRLLKDLARHSRALGSRFRFDGDLDSIPSPIAQTLPDYLNESQSRAIAFVPLVFQSHYKGILAQMRDRAEPKPKLLGVMVLEQFRSAGFSDEAIRRADLISEHVAVALYHSNHLNNIPLMPVWHWLGELVGFVRQTKTAIVATIAALVLGVSLAMFLVPWTYRISAMGTAMPVNQFEVFAPWDGRVIRVLSKGGDIVEEGEVILEMENVELTAELITLENRIQELTELEQALSVQIEEAKAKSDARSDFSLQTEVVKTRTERLAIEEKFAILKHRVDSLMVRAPSRGSIATFQPGPLLANRPVNRGELLIEIMDQEGPWRLELKIPEYRMGHVLEALERTKELDVRFVSMADVSTPLRGHLEKISTRANVSDDQTTIVEGFVSIERDDLKSRTIGMEVHARVDCGKKSLFYCVFGDIVEWVRKYVWW